MTKRAPKAYVVAVTMGYGHLRPAYALSEMGVSMPSTKKPIRGIVINADNYSGIPEKDQVIWDTTKHAYHSISRFKRVPILGKALFNIMDHMQEIAGFYPRRDLSKPAWQLRAVYKTIVSRDWGKDLILKLNKKPLPLVTTFFTIAQMAEYWGYKEKIYCVVTDTDISRSWVALKPKTSRIIYCAPSQRVMERLKLYGVNPKNIFLTGFPLPKENLDHQTGLSTLKADMANRVINLDPTRHYLRVHGKHVTERLGRKSLPKKSNHPLTLTFAVGGAGAQREIGAAAMRSLRQKIVRGKIRLNLIAGISTEVRDYFMEAIKENDLESQLNKFVRIQYAKTKKAYMDEFNKWLRTTDMLWTKPSELSFFAALGLPIIIAPPIGSQEDYNKEWLLALDGGIPQEDPDYVSEWLFDWLKSGFLAKAAMAGYREGFKFGTFNIERLVANHPEEMRLVETVSPY